MLGVYLPGNVKTHHKKGHDNLVSSALSCIPKDATSMAVVLRKRVLRVILCAVIVCLCVLSPKSLNSLTQDPVFVSSVFLLFL